MSTNSGDGVFCPHCGETVAARTFIGCTDHFSTTNLHTLGALAAGSLSSDSDGDEELKTTTETEQEFEAVFL